MIVTFWGVRGTLATPGAQTVRYGGNTTCVSVEVDGKVLVLDAGTGIRGLGKALGGGKEIFILLTHLHTDHLCGFPMFDPLFEEACTVHLLDYHREGQAWSLLNLLDGVHFPLRPDDLCCALHRVSDDATAYLARHGFDVRAMAVNHPGGALGYRIEHRGRAFVFIPDNELEAAHPTASFDALAAFCREADVLCHDAQYRDDELPRRQGWGHSRVRRACDLAVAADVGRLLLFHHDPDRSDAALDDLQEAARAYLAPHGIPCAAAYEGLRLDLEA